jgi:nicotinamide-nucleotide amidase
MTDAINETAEAIARKLVERGESVAIAESSAGGLISAALLGVAGASRYFKGGAVVYTGDQIQKFVGLTADELAKERSSTTPRAAMLARGIRERMGASWGIAETGAAGPTGNRYGDAAGHAALAISGPVDRTEVVETADGDRRRNMDAFTLAALRLLLGAIEGA